MKDKNKNRLTPQLILFIFVYLLFVGVMAAVHINNVDLKVGSGELRHSEIDMILTMVLAVIVVLNVAVLKEPAYRVARVLFAVQLVPIIIGFLFVRDFIVVPALLSIIFMYVITSLVHRHLTMLERKERELHKIAYTDSLTNTPNRRAFNELIMTLSQKDDEFAVVYIDFNKFTHINETAGHEFGDMVLNEAVTRWKCVMDENDFIARLSGDEFALVISPYKDEEALMKHVREFSEVLKNEITIFDRSVFVDASFGIAICPLHSKDPETLVRYADIAMQMSRISGESNILMFNDDMTKSVERTANIDKLMRAALANDGFDLVFQPQYDTVNKKLRGFETLLRLNDSDGRPISPGVFIPLAEKNGLITDIDCYVMKKAMKTFLPMLKKHNESLILSINISAVHLAKNSFLSDVESAVMETGFPPQNLELEITESVFISSIDTALEILNRVKSMGIQLALDDFGTGYASLSYLTKLPIDLLKIDKAFVDGLQQKDNLTDFVAAIISMGHLMHFDVISEGVEDEEQLNTLKMLKCDFIQGYIWGRPMDINAVDELLKSA
ncbi:MAG: EAL domain-containing protein [Firmicutes bacterium]|nr:EAL domain-containing protein [Bacillota bacterium]